MAKSEKPNYEELGKTLVAIAEHGYTDKKKLYKSSFFKGVFSGIGGVIGATVGIALVLFILSLLGEIPFIGTIAESISDTIESSN